MNCFMGYNPLVAKEVKITTWIKEFDGDSPVYPSFPNDGDCFIVYATDEAMLSNEPTSKKTYTNGEWTDAEGGSTPTGTIKITENGEGIDVSEYAYADVNVSGGGGDFSTASVTITNTSHIEMAIVNIPVSYEENALGEGSPALASWEVSSPEDSTQTFSVILYKGMAFGQCDNSSVEVTGDITYEDGLLYITGDGTITVS